MALYDVSAPCAALERFCAMDGVLLQYRIDDSGVCEFADILLDEIFGITNRVEQLSGKDAEPDRQSDKLVCLKVMSMFCAMPKCMKQISRGMEISTGQLKLKDKSGQISEEVAN